MKITLVNRALLFVSFAFVFVFLASGVYAGGHPPTPILHASSPQSVWIADGTTQYKILLRGDTTEMNGLGTKFAEFDYYLPSAPGFTFNLVGVTLRPSDDFFGGFNTMDFSGNYYVARGLLSGIGPVNKVGNIAELRFTVASNDAELVASQETSLQFNMDLEVTHFCSATTSCYSPQIDSVPFTVQTRNWIEPRELSPASNLKVKPLSAYCPPAASDAPLASSSGSNLVRVRC